MPVAPTNLFTDLDRDATAEAATALVSSPD